jgi:excisionase family DNA binding protein
MTETKNLLTIDETASYLSCTPATVRRMLRRGELRGVKFGKFWRVPREVLRRVEAGALTERAPAKADAQKDPADVDALLDATAVAARRAGYKTAEDIEHLIAEVRAELGHDTPRRALREKRSQHEKRTRRSTPAGASA